MQLNIIITHDLSSLIWKATLIIDLLMCWRINFGPGYQGSYPNNIPMSPRQGYQGRRNNTPTGPSTEELAKQFDSMQYNMEEKFRQLEAQRVPMPPLPQPTTPIWPTTKSVLPDEWREAPKDVLPFEVSCCWCESCCKWFECDYMILLVSKTWFY